MPESAWTSSIQNLILIILALIVIAISAWSIYAFVRAIFLFIFSQGKEEKIKKAWNSIRFMIMGIFLTVFLLFMFPTVFKRIWLDDYEEYSAKNIFNKAWELLNKTLQLKDIVKESQENNEYRDQLYYNDDFADKFIEDYKL
jgi:energy-coupling factor transporter transmembrane protein EcfT